MARLSNSKYMRKYLYSYYWPFIIAIPIAPIMDWIEKYLWNDWEFLNWLVIFIVIDTMTSIWYHFKKKDLSSNGFARLPIKLIVYSILLIIGNVMCSFTIQGNSQDQFTLFRTLVCQALMIREAFSIIENLAKVHPNFIPERIRKFLKDWDENGILKK